MIIPGTPIEISLSELLERVSEEEIAFKYIPNFKQVGRPFKSNLRHDKRANSCFIFKDKVTGRLMYKDFADVNIPTKITIIEYVSILYNEDIQSAINRIARDFNKKRSKDILYNSDQPLYENELQQLEEDKSSSNLVIKIKKRNWTINDRNYWNQYYIPLDLLERNNIKSISHMWLYRDNKKIFATEFSDNHPIYSYEYYWSNNIFRRKIYRPFSDNYKWMSNTDYTVVQNYPNIPKEGDLLFIQSSYKDCMVMEILGYNSIAPNSESTWLPFDYWEKIKKRWNNIILFGNNDWDKSDNPGLFYASKNSSKFDIPFIIIPDGETSDISDYVKKYDLEKGKELIETLIKEL